MVALLSTRLTLLIGPTVPVPAPPVLLDALDHVEVTTPDSGRPASRSSSPPAAPAPRI